MRAPQAQRAPSPPLADADRVHSSARSAGLDAFRGLAVLLMLVDHLVLVFGGPELVRDTVTRLAMPMFFLLAGHLAGRVRWRHGGVLLVGLALPLVVPWVDSPNVLVWWALGVGLLAALRWAGVPSWLFVAAALTAWANGIGGGFPSSYEPSALWALMALGTMVPLSGFDWPTRWPVAMAGPAFIGRHPLGWYVGHLLALQAVLLVVVA